MRVAGVIAEYNPFHNGHMRHLEQTRRMTGCDYIVVAMSGAFTQRGDPAMADKWARAQMALMGGADVVFELPAVFAVRSADHFARGGVRLLSGVGAEALSFGCELSDIKTLERISRARSEEPEALRRLIRAGLEEGKSHARARGEALAEYLNLPGERINLPNTALAVEYLRANAQLAKPMEIFPVERNSAYHATTLGAVASASAIRAAIAEGRTREAGEAMPEFSANLIEREGRDGLADPGALDNLILNRLREMEPEELRGLTDVSEGLEMRLKKALGRATTREELLAAMKCKRYTMARLNRLTIHALLKMDRALTDQVTSPPYARVLGFRKRAQPYLRALSLEGELPPVTAGSKLASIPCFRMECRATDLWGLLTNCPGYRKGGRDFTRGVVIVE